MNDLALRASNRDGANQNDSNTAAPTTTRALLVAGSLGAAVSLSLGVYGRSHSPTGLTIDPIQPANLLAFKSATASVAAALVVVQLLSAWRLFGGRPLQLGSPPSWLGPIHRWSGTVAFVFTLPAAYHCLWALGFQTTTPRVVIHSLAGCAFYGAFVTKMLSLRSDRMPRWALPVVGATLATLLTVVWFSSALWFYTGRL